jgi:hypothetical protein
MKPITGTLLEYIIGHLNQQDITPTRTQVAKLLYLVDVEYYRYYRKTVSELPWKFLHYGPYATEIEPLLHKLDIDEHEVTTQKKYKSYIYKGDNVEDTNKLAPSLRIMVDGILDDWGGQNLHRLLDHVYFETEPMEKATRGSLLDFSTIPPYLSVDEFIYVATLPKDIHSELAIKYKSLRKIVTKDVSWQSPPYDPIYFQAIDAMNTEDTVLQCLPFLGNAIVQEGAGISISDQHE